MELEQLKELHTSFKDSVGAHRDMSMDLVALNNGKVELSMPFQQKHASHRVNGGLHNGALAAGIDSACGFVVMLSLEEPQAIATINIRLDHIQRAPAGEDVRIHAECYQIYGQFAYVSAFVNDPTGEKLICNATGVFKLASPGPKLHPGSIKIKH